MPLYDFECAHGHRFERFCSIAEREEPVACEGKVNQMVLDETIDIGSDGQLPEGMIKIDVDGIVVAVRQVPCILKASLIMGQHNNPGGALAHNSAANRDAAREGRYDPNNPSRRFMAKGREWRR